MTDGIWIPNDPDFDVCTIQFDLLLRLFSQNSMTPCYQSVPVHDGDLSPELGWYHWGRPGNALRFQDWTTPVSRDFRSHRQDLSNMTISLRAFDRLMEQMRATTYTCAGTFRPTTSWTNITGPTT